MTFLEKTEGVVLRSLVYGENARILTLFTREAGLISLIVKGVSGKRVYLLSLCSPFCSGEFIYRKGGSDLYRFQDGTIVDEHISLRREWRYIETAAVLARALLQSQLPGKSAPLLYALFLAYLKQIPQFENRPTLVASFKLKLLLHEGLLAFEQETSPIQALLAARSFRSLKEIEISPDLVDKIEELFNRAL
jgi:DNA repair protein RecO (recombination protein O)